MSLVRLGAVLVLACSIAPAATVSAIYELNNSYADSLNGPSLNPQGGFLNSTSYVFGGNQGLNVTGVLSNSGDYSIELRFSFQNVSSYRKVIDFKDRTIDQGLYIYYSNLRFYNYGATGATTIAPDQTIDLVLTRNGTTGDIATYVNGVHQFTVNDASQYAVFSPGIIRLFQDDLGSEHSAGIADRVVFYNGALTASEVQQIYAAGGTQVPAGQVPEPASLGLAAAGLAGVVLLRRRTV